MGKKSQKGEGCAKEDAKRMFEREEECRDVRWYKRDKQEREAD